MRALSAESTSLAAPAAPKSSTGIVLDVKRTWPVADPWTATVLNALASRGAIAPVSPSSLRRSRTFVRAFQSPASSNQVDLEAASKQVAESILEHVLAVSATSGPEAAAQATREGLKGRLEDRRSTLRWQSRRLRPPLATAVVFLAVLLPLVLHIAWLPAFLVGLAAVGLASWSWYSYVHWTATGADTLLCCQEALDWWNTTGSEDLLAACQQASGPSPRW